MEVRNNVDARRYEAVVDGEVAAFIDYETEDGLVRLVHTEAVSEGRGIAGRLVQATLDAIRSDGLRIVPLCPFVARWLARHREYTDLIDREAWRASKRRGSVDDDPAAPSIP